MISHVGNGELLRRTAARQVQSEAIDLLTEKPDTHTTCTSGSVVAAAATDNGASRGKRRA